MQHSDPTRSDVVTWFNADQAQSVLISRKKKAEELSMEMDIGFNADQTQSVLIS